jgi:hypothetical protein
MTAKRVITLILVAMIILLGGIGATVLYASDILDATALAAILGALVGSIFGLLGAALPSIVTLWNRERDHDRQLRDRVSQHALELTQVHFNLRMKSLETLKRKKRVLAPIKVYRELYKALYLFDTTGEWPDTINQLGLLAMFDVGTDEASTVNVAPTDVK